MSPRAWLVWYRYQDYVTILVPFITVVKVQSNSLGYIAVMRIEWDATVVPQHGDAIWIGDLAVQDRRRPCAEECDMTAGPSPLGAEARGRAAGFSWGWPEIAIRSPLVDTPSRARIQTPRWRYNLGGSRPRMKARHFVPAHEIFHTRSVAFESLRAATEAGDQKRADL